jgi:hypothetical protein
MNKTYLLASFAISSLIFNENIYAKEISSKQAFICNGTNSYESRSESKKGSEFSSDDVTESVMLYKFKLNHDEIEKQRPIGYIKFAKSSFQLNMANSLQVCSEDDLNLVFSPICTMSELDWPSDVSQLDAGHCTLEKITGKFSCMITVRYKNNTSTFKSWNYDCKKNNSPVVQ